MDMDVNRYLSLPPDELEFQVNKLTPQQRMKLERLADRLAQHAAFLSGYLTYRGGINPGSDQGHDKALKSADMRCKNVRKALGYGE